MDHTFTLENDKTRRKQDKFASHNEEDSKHDQAKTEIESYEFFENREARDPKFRVCVTINRKSKS